MAVEGNDFVSQYISERLQIGLRFSYFQLQDSERVAFNDQGEVEGFLGSITKLEERQELLPRPFIRYEFLPQLAATFSWETIEFRTRSFFGHYDGDITMSGPSLQLEGRYPNHTRATPYASAGMALLSGSVDHNPDWFAGGRRRLVADDTTAFVLTAGGQFDITDHIAVDLSFRYMAADVDVEYFLLNNSRGVFEFPLDNWAVGLTALWRF